MADGEAVFEHRQEPTEVPAKPLSSLGLGEDTSRLLLKSAWHMIRWSSSRQQLHHHMPHVGLSTAMIRWVSVLHCSNDWGPLSPQQRC